MGDPKRNGNPTKIPVEDVHAGDVLLCVVDSDDALTRRVREQTASPYTHAAIALGNGQVGEATLAGVQIGSIDELRHASARVAVFRSVLWSPDRIAILRRFVSCLARNGAKYNLRGLHEFVPKRAMHWESTIERLERYFTEGQKQIEYWASPYFCSELVVAAFIVVGIIHESAAILLKPDVYAPAHLAEEPTFGWIVGYLDCDGLDIPLDDPFLRWSTFDAIERS